MYKHICVQCLVSHNFRCVLNIGFKDRFLGNENIMYCMEYMKLTKKGKKK